MKRTPLVRRTPLARGTTPLKRTRLRPVSARQRRRIDAWADVGRQLDAQDRHRCEACDVHHLPACNGRREHKHHIQPRSQGGPDTLANCLPTSSVHHDWIHANPAEAKTLGLLKGHER